MLSKAIGSMNIPNRPFCSIEQGLIVFINTDRQTDKVR